MQRAMLDGQAFVLLSDFEGLSIALMEAMASGLVPIISSMRSGVSDLVEDGETGLVVPAEEPSAFVEAATRLARDKPLWHRLSCAARAAVVDRGYTVDACAEKWCRFLEELTGSNEERKALVLPSEDRWEMPERCTRQNGMKLEDRRVAWPKIKTATEEGRPVFVWGASGAGSILLDAVKRRGLSVDALLDSDRKKHGKDLKGIRIFGPSELERLITKGSRPFVVIASQFEEEIAVDLRRLGLQEHVDFVAG